MRLYRNTVVLVFTTTILVFLSVIVIFNNTSQDNITGYDIVNTKVEVFPTVFKNCSFALYPGWNMVSFYCLGMFVPRDTALQSIGNNYGAIFEYTSNDVNDPWKSYNASLPNWTIQQLNYMDRISGYWIYISDTSSGSNTSNTSNTSIGVVDYSYSGVYSNSIIYLYSGWNLIGYPNTNSVNISTGLNISSYTIVKYYNTTTDTWMIYINNSPSNTLEKLETYKSYWVNVSGNPTWSIVR